CSPNPCQNGALCRPRGDGYSCFCVPGFQGPRCQIDVNECASQPCRSGATCLDGRGRFSCLCPPGLTGATCETQIDECQSQPCLDGDRCRDDPDGFTCICLSGSQGHRCENDTAESGTGLRARTERTCEATAATVLLQQKTAAMPLRTSLNSATCPDTRGNHTCQCWPEYPSAPSCDLTSVCSSSPACTEAGARAMLLSPEESGKHGANMAEEGPWLLLSCDDVTGLWSLCQEVINHCDPDPCQNGGRCEGRAGGYTCHCLKHVRPGFAYAGPDCEERPVGCEGHACQNQASCVPSLSDGGPGYACSCPPGHAGPLCATPTTFSFERRGYLVQQSPPVDAGAHCNITLSFRSVLPRAVLFQRNSRGLLLSLELDKGRLRLTLGKAGAGGDGLGQVLELPHLVADGEWHSVETVLRSRVFSLNLLEDSGRCARQPCHKAAPVQSSPDAWASPPQDTVFGGALQHPGGPDPEAPVPPFIGCMRDVFVDRQPVIPENGLGNSAVNVSPGCSHRDRCLDGPCKNGGECVNLWQSYRCRCPRPYEGQDCQEELVTARFGSEDAHSYAAFAVSEDLGPDLSVSFFLRTRRPGGFILALGNGSSQYLRLWLEDGGLAAQLHRLEILKSRSPVDDGTVHFVSLEVEAGRLRLRVADEVQGEVEAGGVAVEAGHGVSVGELAAGGGTSVFGGSLKGCIQDLRVNDRRLQFFPLDSWVESYPLRLMENVRAGCSGDDGCRRNPCLNGGTCSSTWDDFTCTCPPQTAGRRCEEVRWCELAPCPADSECRVLNRGFECYSNATFLNDSTVLTYRGNGHVSRNLTSVSLNLRTRKRNAAVLHAERGSAFITVSVQDGFLFMELQSAAEAQAASTVSLSSRSGVNDGQWHRLQLFMATPWAPTSRWTLVLDENIEEASVSRTKAGNLDFLRQDVDIFLGGLAPDAGWALTGCLSTVELGGVALPYLSSSQVNLTRPQEEQFVQTVCDSKPCLNGGACRDLFNAYSCSCVDGWSGRRCEVLSDACASGPCVHGNCSARGPTFECACDFGFAGVNCDEKADVCQNHRCANGGTCLHGPDRYACLCPENFTGPLCRRPKFPVSVCGDETRNYTCFNGGNCTDRELSCDCPPGFTGHRCEQELDECKSNPCQNGGYCHNLVNKFVCVCDMSYAGDVCQTDLTPVGPTSDLLLSASLVSVLLLAALLLSSVGLAAAMGRRASRGTYSPSRQEKEGSRVEMWSVTQTPPTERLI
uniref:Crumbs cell polarity complex component 1 n=1 Tax=Tetraodon nigroviridis TaxID=99883 RepID=H3CXT7_TETNG